MGTLNTFRKDKLWTRMHNCSASRKYVQFLETVQCSLIQEFHAYELFFLSLQGAFWFMYNSLTNKCTFINLKNTLKFTWKYTQYRCYMFRSSIIIRELALKLAKVIFTLKHSVKLRRYVLCVCVAACHGMACCHTTA